MVKITKDFIPVGHNNRPGYAIEPGIHHRSQHGEHGKRGKRSHARPL